MSEFSIVLAGLPAIVGRSPQVDVHLDDPWVSRVHCEISQVNGTLVVRDLESRNGTLVNGEHIQEAHLLPGDQLTVGMTSVEVRYKPGRTSRQRLSCLSRPRPAQSVYPK
jgi:pSer/pThr/pTyr-binding forkhead associated (FHA) protein